LHDAEHDCIRFKEEVGCLYGKYVFERLLRATQAYSYENEFHFGTEHASPSNNVGATSE
jgi:hypothetical protein